MKNGDLLEFHSELGGHYYSVAVLKVKRKYFKGVVYHTAVGYLGFRVGHIDRSFIIKPKFGSWKHTK